MTATIAATAPIDPTAPSSLSAKAILDQTLGLYGLQGLGTTVWSWFLAGKPLDQIMLDLRQTPEYQHRFPAMAALSAKGHAMSEAQYISYEESAVSIMRAAGLPPGFYDQPEDFTKLLSSEVGLPELQHRIDLYRQSALEAPQEVRDQLQNLYGIGTGALTAYWIDPDRALPLLTKQFQSAQEAGVAQRTGFGQLTQAQAERLAAQGVSGAQAEQGFGKLALQSQLFQALPGDASTGNIDQETQLQGVFGDNAQAVETMNKQAANRVAQFKGSTSFAGSQQGDSGIGSAR